MNQSPAGKAFVALNNFLDGKVAQRIGLRRFLENAIEKTAYTGAKLSSKKSRKFKPSDASASPERLESKKKSNLFDLNYSEEQQMVQQSIVEFVDRFVWPNAEHSSENGKIADDIYKEFDQLGLQYYAVPEKYEGVMTEKSTVTQMIITEELAKGDFGMAVGLLSPIGALNALVKWGTGAQQDKYIPSFLDEENKLIATIAVNEKEALFDPYQLSTVVKETTDGYVLNGQKAGIPLAQNAELYFVAAELPGKGSQVFIVESGLSGIEVQEELSMGLRPAELGNIYFKDVKLSKDALLGDGIDFQEFIAHVRTAWCALAVGTSQKILEYVIEYCNNRVAFGEPITHRQAVAFMIANIKIELECMRLMTQRAASRIEQGLDANRESYLAAVFCSEKSMEIGNNGVQLLGGHGFIRDYPVERWYRDLRSMAISYNGLHL